MDEIKAPKKERKFLKAIGNIALTLARELVLGIGKKVINKIGNKRQGLVIAFILFASVTAIAQYPATGNKQRLGFQTTGDGLVYRGRSSDTVSIKSTGLNNAYHIFDTLNNVLFSYIKTKGGWVFNNSDTVIVNNNTDTTSLSNRINLKLNKSDTAAMLTNYIKSSVNLTTQVTGILPILNGGTGASTQSGARTNLGAGVGSVTSVGMTVPSFLSITGSPITTSGTLAVGLSGTPLPVLNGGTGGTTAAEARTALGATVRGANVFTLADISALSFLRYNADNTVSQRGADGMRSDLGGTTIGQSMFTLTNPSAITFARFNADNTVSALSDVNFRTAIGAGTSSTNGTVTNVTGTLPISVATGTTTPAITIANAAVSTTGVVTASTQTFGGTKTFNGVLNASSDLNVTGIASLNGGVIISPAALMTKIAGLNVSNAIGSITIGTGLSLTSGTLTPNTGDGIITTNGYIGLDKKTFITVGTDFPSTSAQSSSDITFTLTGVLVGQPVLLGVPDGSAPANTNYTAWVSATNTVKIRFNNYSAGAVNPASGSFTIVVINI